MFSQKQNTERNAEKVQKEVNNMLDKEFHSIVDTNLRHTISDIQFQQDADNDTCMSICEYCGILGAALLGIGLIGVAGGYLTWIGFAIKALSNVSMMISRINVVT